jgi:hypothetical protein
VDDIHAFQTGHDMALNRRAFSAAAFLSVSATLTMAALMPLPAAASDGTAPYCIARGGSNGESAAYVGNCKYFDYQECLQAAAGGGNCVQNIDYHGGAPTTPAAPQSRHRRQR